jgi:general secretion pathway protein H
LRRAGFTLVELMTVIAIVGVAATAVVVTMPDPTPTPTAEAERLAARLTQAREQAVLTNRPFAVSVTAQGYGFDRYDGRAWTPVDEQPFKVRRLPEGLTLAPPPEGRIVFDPSGMADPAVVVVSRNGREARVQVDGAGEVRLTS